MSRKSRFEIDKPLQSGNFITQLADTFLLVYMVRVLGLLMIEVATFVVVIEILRMLRDSLFGAYRFRIRRHLGQTFVDSLVILIAPSYRVLTDLSYD